MDGDRVEESSTTLREENARLEAEIAETQNFLNKYTPNLETYKEGKRIWDAETDPQEVETTTEVSRLQEELFNYRQLYIAWADPLNEIHIASDEQMETWKDHVSQSARENLEKKY
jgi:thymidylate synthase